MCCNPFGVCLTLKQLVLTLSAACRNFMLFLQVYAVYFKANRQLIREFENLKNYTAEIYQMPGKPAQQHAQHAQQHAQLAQQA